ncbi:MAG: TolC family protein [Holophagales bacterium]|nr:TolC family protein [Holophagales bacterium]
MLHAAKEPAGCRRDARPAVAVSALLGLVFAAAAGAQTPEPAREMTLSEVASAAVESSRAVRDARLARSSAGYDLYVEEGRFVPTLLFGASAGRDAFRLEGLDSGQAVEQFDDDRADVAAALEWTAPTGASLAWTWNRSRLDRELDLPATSDDRSREWGSAVALVQPLLREGGIAVATAPLSIARLSDLQEALAERSAIEGVVTTAILAARAQVQAEESVRIAERSLASARELVETNQALIDAGRMARVDLVQSETEVARKEAALLAAENTRERSRLALLAVLDLERETPIEPRLDLAELDEVDLDLERLIGFAHEHRPDFLATLAAVEISRLELLVARNARLWNLDLVAAYGDASARPLGQAPEADTREKSWSVGLALGHRFGDRTRRRDWAQAKIADERTALALVEAEQNLRLELTDRVRDIEVKRREVDLATRTRELAERQLDIEGEKLRAGRSSNFQYLSFEGQLVEARNGELAARIAYQNAVSLLDRALGRVLDRWGLATPPESGGGEP